MSNPDSYYDPIDDDVRCECGHPGSDHGDKGDVDSSAMQEALEKIAKLPRGMASSKTRLSEVNQMQRLAKRALSVCANEDCECLEYVAGDSSDDGDMAFDSARDAQLEKD